MKQPKLAALSAVFVVAALMLGACGDKPALDLTDQQKNDISERLAPDGEVVLASEVVSAPAASGGGARSGEDVYNSKCVTCHASGAAGAPKLGAAAEWASRMEKGLDVLYTSAISGFAGMPAKGLCFDCSDDEIKASVDYILENSK